MEEIELNPPKENLVTEEVARLMRTTPSTIRYWRHTGYGPKGFRVGRRVLYRASDVAAWLESRAGSEGSA